MKSQARISLKLSSMIGTAKPVYIPPVLPPEKAAKECFIAQEFAKIQKIGGYVLTNIESNPDDSEGKADVIARLNNTEIGIQLTELKIAHRPQSSDRVRKIVDNLLELILAQVVPPFPVFVDIHSSLDYQNASIRLIGEKAVKLAEIIAEAIANEQFSPKQNLYNCVSKQVRSGD